MLNCSRSQDISLRIIVSDKSFQKKMTDINVMRSSFHSSDIWSKQSFPSHCWFLTPDHTYSSCLDK